MEERERKREREKEILAHARAKRGKLLHASKSRPRRAALQRTITGLHWASPSQRRRGFERTRSEREREDRNGSASRAGRSARVSSFTEVACIFDESVEGIAEAATLPVNNRVPRKILGRNARLRSAGHNSTNSRGL